MSAATQDHSMDSFDGFTGPMAILAGIVALFVATLLIFQDSVLHYGHHVWNWIEGTFWIG